MPKNAARSLQGARKWDQGKISNIGTRGATYVESSARALARKITSSAQALEDGIETITDSYQSGGNLMDSDDNRMQQAKAMTFGRAPGANAHAAPHTTPAKAPLRAAATNASAATLIGPKLKGAAAENIYKLATLNECLKAEAGRRVEGRTAQDLPMHRLEVKSPSDLEKLGIDIKSYRTSN